ncbi:MAG: LVIVD repeat-containing protein [Promethearchaeota archaeon]
MRKLPKLIYIIGIITFLSSSFLIGPVRAGNWDDVPIQESTWVIDESAGFPQHQLSLNTGNYSGCMTYSAIPMKVQRDGNILVEMLSDSGLSIYKISQNSRIVSVLVSDLYSPGPVDPPRYGPAYVQDFLLKDGKMVVVSYEPVNDTSLIYSGTIRIFQKDTFNNFHVISSLNDDNLDSDNFGVLRSLYLTGNYLHVLGNDKRFWTIDVSNWNQPVVLNNITIEPNTTDYKVGELNRNGGFLYFFDGFKTIEIVNITDPANPEDLNENITCSALVHDVDIRDNRLYVSAGKKGIYAYDISDPLNVSMISHYNATTQDCLAVCSYNNDSVFIGNENGTIQCLEILDNGTSRLLSSWVSNNCTSLMYKDRFLYVGTLGEYQQIYRIPAPQNPKLVSTTKPFDSLFRELVMDKFEWLCILNTGGVPLENSTPTLENHIGYSARDGDGIVRYFSTALWTGYTLLYNDTNGDGILTINTTRDGNINELVTDVQISDDVYAYPRNNAHSFNYSTPEVKLYNGKPAIQFNCTYHRWELLAETSTYERPFCFSGFPRSIDIVQVPGLNVTFDLTYSFWLIPDGENYSIKIDTLIQDIDLDFNGAPIPSNLKLFTGFMINLATIFGTSGRLTSTSLSETDTSMDYLMKGGLIAESFMNDWYLKNVSNVLYNTTCERSVIPHYRDDENQAILGDSENICEFVVGVNMDINSTITDLYYDPETRLYGAFREPGVAQRVLFILFIITIAAVVSLVVVRIVIKKKKKKNNKLKKVETIKGIEQR